MADTSGDPPIRVTAEEHIHPALQKLARAFIALTRWRQAGGHTAESEQQPDREASGATEASDDGA
jgi:hypothetical protein